jgi:hypothetical protein
MRKGEIEKIPILLITHESHAGDKRKILEDNGVTCYFIRSPDTLKSCEYQKENHSVEEFGEYIPSSSSALQSCEADVKVICDNYHRDEEDDYITFFKDFGPFHFFIDDIQQKLIVEGTFCYQICEFFRVSQFPETYGWFMCDAVQYYFYDWKNFDSEYYYETWESESEDENETTQDATSLIERLKSTFPEEYHLNNVVRNTYEISSALAFLRNSSEGIAFLSRPFHKRHGPKPCLHMTYNDDCLPNIVRDFHEKYKQLEPVTIVNDMHFDIDPYFDFGFDYSLIDNIVSCLKKVDVRDCMSYEWPVVLGFFAQKGVVGDKIDRWYLRSLYLAISRARVVAEVILYAYDKSQYEYLRRYIESAKLDDYFEIKYYDDDGNV